ncbi:MAG: zf-HC2 domain-containing protein [Pseudomonadota bacterium]
MISCKVATHLLSEQLDRTLTIKEKWVLKFHLFICTGCTNFKSNINFLRKACKHITHHDN